MKFSGNKQTDFQILNRLEDKDLVSFGSTNKYANALMNDQTFWMNRNINKYGKYVPLEAMKHCKGDRDWSEYYIELSKKERSKYPEYDWAKAHQNKRTDILSVIEYYFHPKVKLIKDDLDEYYLASGGKAGWIPKLMGKSLFYWPNGNLRASGDYFYGRKTGEWKEYYENGQLDTVKHYTFEIHPKMDGEFLKYDLDGNLLIKEIWTQGKITERLFTKKD